MAGVHDPSTRSSRSAVAPDASPLARGRELLALHGEQDPVVRFALDAPEPEIEADAMATALMDLFRRSHDAEVFEALVALRRGVLLRRIRGRLRHVAPRLEAEDLLQDVLVNIYRYPDRFDASRPGAFRAWSSTIVDNSIRRRLRRRRSGPEIVLQSSEDLCREADVRAVEPGVQCAENEACRDAAGALGLFLRAYLNAFLELNERERFVLQMVEVQGMRYAEIAEILGVRPEALKMVVFRARRRIHDKLTVMFARACAGPEPADAAA